MVTEVKKTTFTRTLGAGGAAAAALTSGGGTTEGVVMRSGGGASASGFGGATEVKMFGVESEGGARQSAFSYTKDRGMSEYVVSEHVTYIYRKFPNFCARPKIQGAHLSIRGIIWL